MDESIAVTASLSSEHKEILHLMSKIWPDPPCFLWYTTPFSLLVAVVLSAQSTDQRVNRIMPGLVRVANTPEKMLFLGKEKLLPMIRSIGLYRRKADYIMMLSQELIDWYSGCLPQDLKSLMRLSGVGQKTANVVLNVVFGQPTIPVDTHVFRVARRMGFSLASTVGDVEKELNDLVPMPWKKNLHTWFILHGRTYCKARQPKCPACPFSKHCPSRQ
jgi:endonuclease-3